MNHAFSITLHIKVQKCIYIVKTKFFFPKSNWYVRWVVSNNKVCFISGLKIPEQLPTGCISSVGNQTPENTYNRRGLLVLNLFTFEVVDFKFNFHFTEGIIVYGEMCGVYD